MSEQVKRDCDHGRQLGKCVDCDYAALESDYATLQAECEWLRAEIDSWEKCYKEIHAPALREAHDYISELRAELAAIKAQQQ